MIVGFSGLVIIARTGNRRLDELACVRDLFVAVTDNVRAGGWRIGFLGPLDDDTSPEELAKNLAQQTAAPAIALSVFDSDCAFATADDPCGDKVEFYLNEQTVRALAEDDLDYNDGFVPLNCQAATGLLAWAAKAGLAASADRLATALEQRPGPFGDGILNLVEALGIAELSG